MPAHHPHEWLIRDDDDGWVLRIRYAVPLRELVPYFRREWLVVELVVFVIAAAFWIVSALVMQPPRAALVPTLIVALAFFGSISLSYWVRVALMDWYARANRVVHASVRGSNLETTDGVFDVDCLRTLRLEENGAHPGRRLLVFNSHSMDAAPLIGWPGLTTHTADAVLSAVRTKLASTTENAVGC